MFFGPQAKVTALLEQWGYERGFPEDMYFDIFILAFFPFRTE